MACILIVDDSEDSVSICSRILAADSHRILVARTGEAALEIAGREQPDVVLLDVQMPDMDGFEVCRRLKANPATATLPVLFITAVSRDADSVFRGLQLGGDDYIFKPFNSAELRARIAVLARLKRTLDDLRSKNLELETSNRALQDANQNMVRVQEALAELALTDSLTGLHNRRYFDRRLAETYSLVQRQYAPLHLLALDLDHFKATNDRYGHLAGDAVLVAFADILQRCVRLHDVVARTGGEEFVVLMVAIPHDQAVRAAERIREQVAQSPIDAGGKSIHVTTSIGMASLLHPPAAGQGPQELVRVADSALYRAKNAGRNRVVIETV